MTACPRRSYALLLAAALFVQGCGGRDAPEPEPAKPVPVFHELPDFSLIDDAGRPLARADLKGKVWVAAFMFTSCATVCPAMAQKIRGFQHTLPDGTVLVSISVDPGRDTPEALREYARYNDRVPGKWLLATGEWEAISELAQKGFYLGGKKRQMHSPRFALVDQWGRLRGYYDTREEAEMTKLLRDVSLVLAEPSPETAQTRPEGSRAGPVFETKNQGDH